ncbi:putative MFS family arabinose efflux permease [Streptomyces puniciscabiei]|uniref:Putative MFS family arabinose efflux permease n=2 Tax=Streptomyces puniciscabiei TaxID=164348 RepID=A0A542U9Q6_9ACTN|nr:MFS transporter [Streptomyces puniciscabiei]TQK95807.1 putative MFS family arabinose efflux permease [Streptomyces puniciscabiei]
MTTAHVAVATPYRRRWPGLAALLLGEAMNLLDATVVQVAAPAVHADLGGPVSDVQWFGAAYTLPFAVLLITGGRLGDIAGRRRMFVLGVTLFTAASVACALAPSPGLLIAFRAVQGAAAALIIPQTIGLIKAMFSGEETAKALGSIGPVMGLAAVCGPVLGGVLTHADLFGSSWRSAFLVNVPVAALVLALARNLPENRAPHRPALDWPGTALAALGTGLLVYPLIGGDFSQLGAYDWVLLGTGLLVLAGFARHQRRTARPLLEPGLFTHRGFPAALVTSTAFFAVTNGLTVVVVLQLQLDTGTGVLASGLSLLPWSAGLALASWWTGSRLVRRHGRRVMPYGLGLLLTGLLAAVAAYRTTTPGHYPVALLPALALVGLGAGLFTPAFFTLALHPLRPQEIGSAAGLLNAVQQLGATLGVAVLGSTYLAGTGSGAPQAACWVAVGLLGVAWVASGSVGAAEGAS